MLPEQNRLRLRRDFERVYRRGKSAACPALVLYCLRRGGANPRIGFSISRKVGHAVSRNRLKRQLRHLVRERLPQFQAGRDYVFVIRPAAAALDFQQLGQAVDKVLREIRP